MNYFVLIGLLLVFVPVMFVWHLEIGSYSGNTLTNGFMYFDGLQVYHLGMYSLFLINFLAAYVLITRGLVFK